MADRPLLVLPRPGQPVERTKRRAFPPNVNRPTRERQGARLTPRFEALQQTIDAHRARFQMDAQGLVPEDVVVLETVGTVDRFVQAVERIPGMAWLAEVEEVDIPPDNDFFARNTVGERTNQPLGGRLFMVFANQAALDQVVSLWRSWQAGRSLARGLGPWAALFARLRDVRRWGVQDRLHETGVLDDWRERVGRGEEVVPCELELWHRGNQSLQQQARDRVVALVESQGGVVLDEATLSEIAYQALLVRLPAQTVSALLSGDGDDLNLVQCEQIQFIRASGQMAATPIDDASVEDEKEEDEVQLGALPVEPPTVALLDGLPLEQHRSLKDRIVVDDPDDFQSNYQPREQVHGTAMASLIAHGDLGASEPPLPSRLYVRPIMCPDPKDWMNHRERVPESTLVVDLLHRAVRRLFEGEAGGSAVAPDVAVINLSIGIHDRPFEQALSPLARLLDWLAWHHKVLFVVSAGNYARPICLGVPSVDLNVLDKAAIERETLQAVAADARHRRLLSPAESLNALTVGATHADVSSGTLQGWIDPLERGLPSPMSAQGLGFRRAIKPDVFAPGGRVALRKPFVSSADAELEVHTQRSKPGQRVAAPGLPGDLGRFEHTRGTSNAAALTSRCAAFVQKVLDDLRDGPSGNVIDDVPRAVWLKAMIAHGADWGTAGERLTQLLRNPSNRRKFKEYVTRLLGYGTVDVDRVSECTAWRVTAISGGELGEDESHTHAFPLPRSLNGLSIYKRLAITLAWLSPINPRHQAWRKAQLWFDPPMGELRVKRLQADSRAVRRGTLQHEILEGRAAASFNDGDALEIRVSCRADAGTLEERVPYALVTTLEVAEDLALDIYDEVRTEVQAARLRV